jgi:hypothetical protein
VRKPVDIGDELKRYLAWQAKVPVDDLQVVERWTDFHRMAEVFRLADGRRVLVTDEELVRLEPRKDPVVEAFTIFATARHEAHKRRTE